MQTEDEDADIEAALDTADEMSVGQTLRRRKASKDKRSIAKRGASWGTDRFGLGGVPSPQGRRRSSSVDKESGELGGGGSDRGIGVGGGVGEGESGRPLSMLRRRTRRHSTPSFTLGAMDGESDGYKRERLQRRLDAMRRLPRGSRFASQQIDIITKALGILDRTAAGGAGGRGGGRTSDENDELSRLLAAISL